LGALDREHAKLVGPFHSTTRANARLLALTRAGLLARTFVGTIAGGRKAVYLPPERRRSVRAGRRGGAAVLEHQLAVASVYQAFRWAKPPCLPVAEWQTFSAPIIPGSRLIPDGLLELTHPSGTVPVFVEADRGTEALSIWRQKAAKYLELAVGRHHESVCGPGPFYVAVVAPGRRRCANIARAVSSVTHKLFWITTAEDLAAHGPSASIWLRPDGSKPEQLPWHILDYR
jgi:hypothetical protein